MVGLLWVLAILASVNCQDPSLDEEVARLVGEIEAAKAAAQQYQEEEKSFNVNDYEAVEDQEQYDFVIIGGGTAGSLLANRLSSRENWKVLVLEAGGEETEISKIPAMKNDLFKSPMTWNLRAEPNNKSCLAFVDNVCSLKHGRVLGGSSSTLDMINQIGLARDYQNWGFKKNWTFMDVIKIYNELEADHLQNEHHNCYNKNGPVWMENPSYHVLPHEEFLSAGKALGLHRTTENCPDLIQGIGFYRVLVKEGQRQSSATTFLYPAMSRPNLKVSTNSFVTKIIFENKVATGVQYVKDDKLITVKASKEVILTAGSVKSAQILQLSGIGPKDLLEKHGIEVVANLPVGQSIKTAVYYYDLNFVFNDQTPLKTTTLEEDVREYLENRKGPLTRIKSDTDILAYLKIYKFDYAISVVNVYMARSIPWYNNEEEKLKPEIRELHLKSLQGKVGFTPTIILNHPSSEGKIEIANNDPFSRPLVFNNILDQDRDVEIIHLAIKSLMHYANSTVLQNYKGGNTLLKLEIPGCPKAEENEDEYWKCSIRHFSAPLNRDITGAVPIGPDNNKKAVVDEELRVRSVKGLRVAGGAAIPVTISGDLTKPSMMVAEKCARFILNTY